MSVKLRHSPEFVQQSGTPWFDWRIWILKTPCVNYISQYYNSRRFIGSQMKYISFACIMSLVCVMAFGQLIVADSNLWLLYQGAMVQTIQIRYCQQFLSNHVNFKVRALFYFIGFLLFSRFQQGAMVFLCIHGNLLGQALMNSSRPQDRDKIGFQLQLVMIPPPRPSSSNAGLQHFFGFYPVGTTVTQLPIHIHSDHFSMIFEAQGFMGIKVSPGDWMDQSFIRTYSAELNRLGFIGPNSKLPLVPRVIWVALKPAVSITLKTTEIQKLVSTFQDSKTAAISIGGIRFTSHSIQALDDTDRGHQPDYVTLSEPEYLDIDANFDKDMEDILDF